MTNGNRYIIGRNLAVARSSQLRGRHFAILQLPAESHIIPLEWHILLEHRNLKIPNSGEFVYEFE